VQYLWLQNKKEKKGQEKSQEEKEITNPRTPVAETQFQRQPLLF